MTESALLILYCVFIALAALTGGWLPQLLRLSHTGMQLAMSFIGGMMLGVGVLHLLPHSYFELHDIYPCVCWMLVGFLTMFFIQRVFHFHHHDAPEADGAAGCDHDHGDAGHVHHHHHDHGASHGRAGGWIAALVGLALHSAADGMALAASVAAEPGAAGESWIALPGLAVFLVIFLHIPFDALTLTALMTVNHESSRARHIVNFLYAATVPIGVALFLFGVGHTHAPARQVLGAALAFSAGTFLCISTSDLLPELQFHAHDRVKLSTALLLGLALAVGIVLIESSTHNHGAHGLHEGHDAHAEHDEHAPHPADEDHEHAAHADEGHAAHEPTEIGGAHAEDAHTKEHTEEHATP